MLENEKISIVKSDTGVEYGMRELFAAHNRLLSASK